MSASITKIAERDKQGRITRWKPIKADNFRYVELPVGQEVAILTLFRRLKRPAAQHPFQGKDGRVSLVLTREQRIRNPASE